MDNGNKAGIGAALAALLVGAAHFGDDLIRGLGRAVRETPSPGAIDDIARPVAEGATSVLKAPVLDTPPSGSGQVSLTFKNAVAGSAEQLARSKPGLVQFEIASGKLKIGSDRRLSRSVKVGYREINVYSTTAIAGTPLALCLASADKSTEPMIRQCVERTLDKMAGVTRNF